MPKQAYFGDFGSEAIESPQNQYRLKLAQELLGQGQQPVQSVAEGITRLGSGALGGYFAGQAFDSAKQNKAAAQSTIADALKAYSGQPAQTQTYAGGQTINWNERPGDAAMAARILSQNPDTAATGFNLYANEAQSRQELANQLMLKQLDLQSAQAMKQAEWAQQEQLERFKQEQENKRAEMRYGPEANQFTYQVGGGFAGGTPSQTLYNPKNKIDLAQQKADLDVTKKLELAAQQAAGTAQGDISLAEQAKQADALAYTSSVPFLAGLNQIGNQALATVFGSPEAAQKVQAYETLSAYQADAARAERTPGEGAISDFDAKQFRLIVPGPDKSQQFNQAAIVFRQEAAKQAQDKAQFLTAFKQQNRNLVGADDAWRAYTNSNPILSQNYNMAKPETMLNPNRKSWQEFFSQQQNTPTPIQSGLTPEEEYELETLRALQGME